jgi:hypothetical protein
VRIEYNHTCTSHTATIWNVTLYKLLVILVDRMAHGDNLLTKTSAQIDHNIYSGKV